MSFKLHRLVYPRQFGSPSRKAVALKLADVANDDGTNVFPSIAFVASQTELSRSTVGRIMRAFREEGLLILVSPAGSGKYRTNEHVFNLERIKRRPMCAVADSNDAWIPAKPEDEAAAESGEPIKKGETSDHRWARELDDGKFEIPKGTKPFEAWQKHAIKISDHKAEGECHYCPEDGSIIRPNLWPKG